MGCAPTAQSINEDSLTGTRHQATRPHDAAVGVAGVAEDAAVAAADQPERARCTVLILAAPLDAVRRPVPVALGIGKQVGIGRRAAVPVVGGQQLYAHI